MKVDVKYFGLDTNYRLVKDLVLTPMEWQLLKRKCQEEESNGSEE